VHRHLQAAPEPFRKAMAPDREGLVVAVEGRLTWSWLAALGAHAGLAWVLGQALSRPAIPGGNPTHDPREAHTMAVWRRGGRRPQASGSPAPRRATRDLRRRRTPLRRPRAARGARHARTWSAAPGGRLVLRRVAGSRGPRPRRAPAWARPAPPAGPPPARGPLPPRRRCAGASTPRRQHAWRGWRLTRARAPPAPCWPTGWRGRSPLGAHTPQPGRGSRAARAKGAGRVRLPPHGTPTGAAASVRARRLVRRRLCTRRSASAGYPSAVGR
jgi:hypothetical protein